MRIDLPIDPDSIKGFLSPAEGEALYRHALTQSSRGAVLEIGSYCGKSTLYLGCACQRNRGSLFAVDHHQGSEEHQIGEYFHDPELVDPHSGRFDSFRAFRQTLRRAALEDTVIPLVSSSTVAARHWRTPLAMLFIDGGHSMQAALTDYRSWVGHLIPGAILAIHDLYPDPALGGQAPITIYRLALASGLFEALASVDSLGLLRRIG